MMKSWLTFGLPLGPALVVVAVLNSTFAFQYALNFIQLMVTLQSNFTDHLYPFGLVTILIGLTLYLWIAVIHKGRGGHLSIWIAGTLVLLFLKIVISCWTLLVFLSTKDSLYWRKLWNMIIDICVDLYFVNVSVRSANALWRKNNGDEMESEYSSHNRLRDEFLNGIALPPVGLPIRAFFNYFKETIDITTRVFITVDVFQCAHDLMSIKIPAIIFPALVKNSESGEAIDFIMPNKSIRFGRRSDILLFFEENLITILRILVGFWGIYVLCKKFTTGETKRVLFANILVITFSLFVYFILFGLFEEISTTNRFLQFSFTLDILFRLSIIYLLTICVENTRAIRRPDRFVNECESSLPVCSSF